jgi:acetoin:2,6-dichlorophenolindophenol oxidoreductase subunit alpha
MELTDTDRRRLLTDMVRVERLDQFAQEANKRGDIKIFWHSAEGHVAPGVAAVCNLRPDDYLYYHYRGHGLPYLLPLGVDPGKMMAEHYGKATGYCESLSAFHVVAPEIGVYGWSAWLGVQFGVTLGYGRAAKTNRRGQVAMCVFGDGAANKGQFHESLNMSALWQLPILWICENNQRSVATDLSEHLSAPSGTYVEQARSYGIPSTHVDGGDPEAVWSAVADAVARAREGGGPSYVESKIYRPFPHVQGVSFRDIKDSPGAAQSSFEEVNAVRLYAEKLVADGVVSRAELKAIKADADAEARRVEEFAQGSPCPDIDVEYLTHLLYTD